VTTPLYNTSRPSEEIGTHAFEKPPADEGLQKGMA
jgi:hypothetical protein